VVEKRQVWDIPPITCIVTEHQAMQAVCSCCGKVNTAEFPEGVNAPVQYGSRAKAAMVHLNQNHAISQKRTAMVMGEIFDMPVSQATVVKASDSCAKILQPTVDKIAEACIASPTLHADETGMRVAKKINWIHVLATRRSHGWPATTSAAARPLRHWACLSNSKVCWCMTAGCPTKHCLVPTPYATRTICAN
jgi:transposase